MNLKHLDRRSHSHPHRNHPLASAAGRGPVSKRRSTRMALNAAVGLSGEDRQKAAFTLTVKATNLNRHGAAVQINRELPVGSVLKVKNQRGTQISARVVAHLSSLQGVSTYGIEFVEQDEAARNFWGISFPSGS
ncbi:MAG TPA: PilZ domain-containing protein [Candidatus Dormibacteraeota bacterium]|nr:PilZ domain-containing protein [Candidatus Dormibacteraeota bacterium]